MAKKIIHVGSDEDGETYFAVGNITELGAFRAIRKFQREDCGLDDEELITLPLEKKNFYYSEGKEFGDFDGYYWWGNPPKNAKPIGIGWIKSI